MIPIDNGRVIKKIDYSIRQQTKEYQEIIACDISIDRKMICLVIFNRSPNLTKMNKIALNRIILDICKKDAMNFTVLMGDINLPLKNRKDMSTTTDDDSK